MKMKLSNQEFDTSDIHSKNFSFEKVFSINTWTYVRSATKCSKSREK